MLHDQRKLIRGGSNLSSANIIKDVYRSSNNLISSKESHNRKRVILKYILERFSE